MKLRGNCYVIGDNGLPGRNYNVMLRSATAQATALAYRAQSPARVYFVPKDEYHRLAVWFVRLASEPAPKNWNGEDVAHLTEIT